MFILNLISKYNINFTGILYVGAYECSKLSVFEKYLDRNNILWIEALKDKVELCKKNINNILIENSIISDKIDIVKFNISKNNDEYSSLLNIESEKCYLVKTEILENLMGYK